MTDLEPLAEWEPQTPPSDFPDRVLAAMQSQRAGDAKRPQRFTARRWRVGWAVALGTVAVAASLAVWVDEPRARGELTSVVRTEQSIGRRAVAVLEPGSQVRFDGADVWQNTGNVFYRVNPGETFRVRTPVGVVEVRGTCFQVDVETRSAAPSKDNPMPKPIAAATLGAAVGVLVTVTVYEGRVQLSHESSNPGARVPELQLNAGERAALDSEGMRRIGTADELGLDARPAAAGVAPSDADLATLRAKIDHVRRQKATLEDRLQKAQEELAKYEGSAGREEKNEYDLTQEDWKELAKTGSIKFRTPCPVPNDWQPKSEELDELGLAPADADALATARRNSARRLTDVVRPLCAAAVGNQTAVEAIDNLTCLHVVADVGHKKDEHATSEAMRQVAEVHAGMIAGPTPEQLANPVFAGFYAYTSELAQYQNELAESFGPEQAKAIAFGKGCFHVIQHRVGPR